MIVNNTVWGTGVHITDGSNNNEIHENCFYDNDPQAWDDVIGGNNDWDSNYWSPPPQGDGNYTIPGGAGSEDSNPLSCCPLTPIPDLTAPGIIALADLFLVYFCI